MSSDLTPVIQAAERAAAPVVLGDLEPGKPTLVSIPAGRELRELDLERYLPNPIRKTGEFEFQRAASFIGYLDMHARLPNPEPVTLWADVGKSRVVAVMNDHTNEQAGWRDHVATLKLDPTPAWRAWTTYNGQQRSQVDFAEFVEDRITEIADPPGADLLTMARSFQATKGVDFRSDIRLDSGGIQLQYVESIEASSARGTLEIPDRFTLMISPFEGYDPVQVTARLRYRLREGTLTLGYVIDRLEDVVREAFAAVVDEIEQGTSTTVWYGTP